MADYIVTNKAVEDLSKIWEYSYKVWSEAKADKYYHMLFASFQELAEGKIAGKKYPEVRIDILGFRSGQHIIFYRKLKENRIEITRVLHNRMDLKNRVQE